MKKSTLSPSRIKSAVYRAKFYQEISQSRENWDLYEITEGEEKRPDLIAYRFYGTTEAQQIVMVAAGQSNLIDKEFEIGKQIPLPPRFFITQRIRFYEEIEKRHASG